MTAQQMAQVLRVLASTAAELADIVEDRPAEPGQPPAAARGNQVSHLPAWARKRGLYLLAYLETPDGVLTLDQVSRAARRAEYGNPGSATTQGYVEVLPGGRRRLTEKGRNWLQRQGLLAS